MVLRLARHVTLVVLTLSLAVCGIYQGKRAGAGDPTLEFFVHFRKANKPNFVCGGTLVAPRLVLTAAHCKIQAGLHTAYLGSRVRHSSAHAKLVSGITHVRPYQRSFAKLDLLYDKFKDIAVVSLAVTPEQVFEAGLRPVSIDWTGQQERKSPSLLTVGLGGTEGKKTTRIARSLRLLAVTKISTTLCLRRYFPEDHPRFALCALASNSGTICAGDSGGPLLADVIKNGKHEFNLVGVVIATTANGRQWTCEPGAVILSMRMKHFRGWWKRKVETGLVTGNSAVFLPYGRM